MEQQELDRLLDQDAVVSEALERAEQTGIIFIDEIDKIAISSGSSSGPGCRVKESSGTFCPLWRAAWSTRSTVPLKRIIFFLLRQALFI